APHAEARHERPCGRNRPPGRRPAGPDRGTCPRIPAPDLADDPRARPVARDGKAPPRPKAGRGGAQHRRQCLRMLALSVPVLSAGVLSLGLTVAVACRVLPARALTHTETVIMVRLPAPSGAALVHVVARSCLWHCQSVPLPPWATRIPRPVSRVTTMGC